MFAVLYTDGRTLDQEIFGPFTHHSYAMAFCHAQAKASKAELDKHDDVSWTVNENERGAELFRSDPDVMGDVWLWEVHQLQGFKEEELT